MISPPAHAVAAGKEHPCSGPQLRALPDPYREVLRLRYEEGLRPQAIARQLGITQLNTEISSSHHESITFTDNVVNILKRDRSLHLGNNLNV